MKMYLMSKGLWEVVDGGGSTVAASIEQKAHAAIVLNLNDSQLMHVVVTTSAFKAWTALARAY